MTAASAANAVPVIVIDVPPVVLTACGEMPVIESLVGEGAGATELLVAHDPNSHPAASRKEIQGIR